MNQKTKIIKIVIQILFVLLLLGIIGMGIYLYMDNRSIPPKEMVTKYSFKQEEFKGKNVYILTAKEKQATAKTVLYLHGGSYMGEIAEEHWKFVEDLANDTGYTVILPDYPLTPKYQYTDVFEMMDPLYQELVNKVGSENLIVMGDSAGGGLALALCEKIGEENREIPHQLILLSPWLDTRMTNPEIDEVQKYDKMLNKLTLRLAGEVYAGESGKNSYLVNPIDGPLEKLKNVVIFTGTYDILNPDVKRLATKAKEQGLTIEVRETEKAPHVWMLARHKNGYKAEEAYQEIVNLVKEG